MLHPGLANVSKEALKEKVAKMYDVRDSNQIYLFGFKTQFGGGKSTGFGLIYDSIDAAKKFEPLHRLRRNGLEKEATGSRKQRKEKKNRIKRLRGKNKVSHLIHDTTSARWSACDLCDWVWYRHLSMGARLITRDTMIMDTGRMPRRRTDFGLIASRLSPIHPFELLERGIKRARALADAVFDGSPSPWTPHTCDLVCALPRAVQFFVPRVDDSVLVAISLTHVTLF